MDENESLNEVEEQPEENQVEEQPIDESVLLTDEERFARAEQFLKVWKTDYAQRELDCVKEESGRKHFIQSKIYKAKCWYTEQRKQLKKAIKLEPENEEYKKEWEELEKFRQSPEYKRQLKQQQLGDAGSACADGCGECCCMCLCQGICEGLSGGC